MLWSIVARIAALVFFLVSLGRVRGRQFIVGVPFDVRTQKGGRIHFGARVRISANSRMIARRGTLTVGDHTYIGKNSTLIAFADLTIGRHTLIAENCSIHTEEHGPPHARNDFRRAAVVIGSNVWLGAGVVVTSGCVIADDVTVGANSVVTNDLAVPGTYAGVPAVQIYPRE